MKKKAQKQQRLSMKLLWQVYANNGNPKLEVPEFLSVVEMYLKKPLKP